MSAWTTERAEQLASDAASVKAAHGLAKPAKWVSLGRDAHIVWGECQGSGAQPYQVRADLDDGGYKCSCPSRKQPCKHTLALLLLVASGASMPSSTAPAFVVEWRDNRAQRAQARAERKPAVEKPPAAAQARRIEKRETRIEAGLDQLEAWLEDLMLQGLAAAFWAQMAARLVDAQAPGLARRVSELEFLAVSGPDWQSTLLAGLGRLQLAVDAYRRLDVLPDALVSELRTIVGWTQNQDALLQRDGVRDRWHVAGQRQTEGDTVRTQYTWLMGRETGRTALVLDFATGTQALPATLAVGQVIGAELVFYDGVPGLRALVKSRDAQADMSTDLAHAGDIAAVQAMYGRLLAVNPWLERWPTVLGPVTVRVDSAACHLVDDAGRRVTTPRSFRHAWHLLALAGHEPVTVFGEWNGRTFEPVSVACDGALFTVAAIGDMPVLAKAA